MRVYHFAVVITQDEDGMYMARVPDLPGCHTQAKSLPKLYERVQEAIELCVEVQALKAQRVPQRKFIGVQQIEVNI